MRHPMAEYGAIKANAGLIKVKEIDVIAKLTQLI